MDGMLAIVQSFILLLVIMDPVLSLAAFISLTKGKKNEECRAIAFKGVAVAALVFLTFAFGGNILLQLLNVNIDSFKAAGGIILILMGVQLSLGISFPKDKNEDVVSEVAVVIGTPLISGPATITSTILLVNEFGLMVTLIAGVAALVVVLISLLAGTYISKTLGRGGMQVLSTMMGIVTLAWGMQFVISGIQALLGVGP